MGPDGQEKASVVKAERELKVLKAENAKLSKDLEETRSLYKQLVEEGPSESFHERRVHLLKSQVIQLERQLLLHSDALSSRSEVLLLVENSLHSVVDQLRELLASDVKGPSVPVQRSQLTGLIETAEGARLRLYKNVESNSSDRLSRAILYMGPFLKPSSVQDGVTLLDVCSGKIEHLNLKEVARLESKLFGLHRQLQALHQALAAAWSSDSRHQPSMQHLPLAVGQRVSGLLAQSQRSVAESCSDLLALSVLIPAAPWPLVTRPVSAELSLDSVMSALPSFPRSKQQQGRACIDALLKACNYSRNVSKLEAKACASELHFHQSVYDVQMKYMESLFTAVREAYAEFEQSTQTLLCQPLKKILEDYSVLVSSTSEEALRDFLSTFKAQASELEKVVDILTINKESSSSGQEALSTFGRDFFASVDALARECSSERDRLAEEIDAVKKMKEDHTKQGLKVFERPKPGAKDSKEEYQEVIQDAEVETKPENGTESGCDVGEVFEATSSTTAGTSEKPTARAGSIGASTKTKSVGSAGCKGTSKEETDRKVPRGPRVIAKLGSSQDLEDVLKETGRNGLSSQNKDTSTPVKRGADGEGVPRPSSRIPRSGSSSRLKLPSPRHSTMSSKTPGGSRQAGIPPSSKDSVFRSSLSGTPGVRRSASEGSRLSMKASGNKPGSQGSS